MTDESKHTHTVRVAGGPVANTTAIISESFNSPNTHSVIFTGAPVRSEPPPVGPGGPVLRMETMKDTGKKITVQPAFKMIFLTVAGITFLAFVTVVVMALGWPELKPNQQTVFNTADTVLKAGVGAIFGLLGGKQI